MNLVRVLAMGLLFSLGMSTPVWAGHQIIVGNDANLFIQVFTDSKIPQLVIKDNTNQYFVLDQVICQMETTTTLNHAPIYMCIAMVDGKPTAVTESMRLYELLLSFVDKEDCKTKPDSTGELCQIRFQGIACVIQPDKENIKDRYLCAMITPD